MIAWPLALVLAPFLLYAAASPVLGRQRIDRLGSAARGALGLISAYTTETIQGWPNLSYSAPPDGGGMASCVLSRDYQGLRLALLADLSFQASALDVAHRSRQPGRRRTWRGAGNRMACFAATAVPLVTLISVAAFLPVSEIAQVGRQLADTIASTRRLHVVHAEPVCPVTDGYPGPGGGRRSADFGRGRLHLFRTDGAGAERHFVRCTGRVDGRAGGAIGRWKNHGGEPDPAFLGPKSPGTIRLDGTDLRELTLDGLRARIALVAQDTYLFNDTLGANVRLAAPDATAEQVQLALSRAARRSSWPGCRRGCRHALVSVGFSCRAVSGNALPSPGPS